MKNLSVSEIKAIKTTPARAEWAITYLALGENGTGLNGEKFDLAMKYAREWKTNMVNFLTGKKNYVTQTEFTRTSAIAFVDELFKRRYEAEVRAHNSPTVNTYWTREAGNLEFGHGMFEEVSRLDECDQPICPNPEVKTSWKQKQANHAQFLVYLAQGHSGSKVLRNASIMMANGALTISQYKHLAWMAGDLVAARRMVKAGKSSAPAPAKREVFHSYDVQQQLEVNL